MRGTYTCTNFRAIFEQIFHHATDPLISYALRGLVSLPPPFYELFFTPAMTKIALSPLTLSLFLSAPATNLNSSIPFHIKNFTLNEKFSQHFRPF